jgi:hypothetical protein
MAMASVKQSLRETIDRGSVLKGCWWAGPLIHRKQFLIWKILGGPRPSLVPTKLRQWPHGNYIRQVYSSNICDGRSSKRRSVLALTQLGSCSIDAVDAWLHPACVTRVNSSCAVAAWREASHVGFFFLIVPHKNKINQGHRPGPLGWLACYC